MARWAVASVNGASLGRVAAEARPAPSLDTSAPTPAPPGGRPGPGRSAAPDEHRLVLLPSGPDAVRESPLRGTRSSTSPEGAALEAGDLGRDFSPDRKSV